MRRTRWDRRLEEARAWAAAGMLSKRQQDVLARVGNRQRKIKSSKTLKTLWARGLVGYPGGGSAPRLTKFGTDVLVAHFAMVLRGDR